ncbi:MAG: transaldolase [Gammaproteobacteria bacterium]|nr:transaldolase [Gammaproteobacteria bacterium]
MNPLVDLQNYGQSPWYDNIQRAMLRSGELERMIREDGLKGVTSNPTIFEKAINGSNDYDDALAHLLAQNPAQSSRDLFYSLAIEDIQQAADLLRPVYDKTGGCDGMISLEVSPDLAHDTASSVAEARRLAARVNRPNLMIKVPATREGLPAVTALITDGINVNVTLLFSVLRYEEVIEAYISGLEQALQNGKPLNRIASVASFFVSRVDALVDKLLDEKIKTATPEQQALLKEAQGKAAIANAKIAYQSYERLFATPRFAKLREAGAHAQRLLWASTGVKNPNYSDVMYIDTLIGPDTVNTIPPATYKAFKEHGKTASTLQEGVADAHVSITLLTKLGIDMDAVTQQLEDEGVESFISSFKTLLDAIETKAAAMTGQSRAMA